LYKDLQEATNLSPEQRKCSWRVIILAATLWPIVLPISYLEKRSKARQLFCRFSEGENTQAPLLLEIEIERDAEKQQKTVQTLS
jgi:hypothetical protein